MLRPSPSPSSAQTTPRHHPGTAARKAAASRDFAEAASLAAAEQLCAEFQPAQRGFVTFLAAVDSHRLGVHVTRHALPAPVSGLPIGGPRSDEQHAWSQLLLTGLVRWLAPTTDMLALQSVAEPVFVQTGYAGCKAFRW